MPSFDFSAFDRGMGAGFSETFATAQYQKRQKQLQRELMQYGFENNPSHDYTRALQKQMEARVAQEADLQEEIQKAEDYIRQAGADGSISTQDILSAPSRAMEPLINVQKGLDDLEFNRIAREEAGQPPIMDPTQIAGLAEQGIISQDVATQQLNRYLGQYGIAPQTIEQSDRSSSTPPPGSPGYAVNSMFKGIGETVAQNRAIVGEWWRGQRGLVDAVGEVTLGQPGRYLDNVGDIGASDFWRAAVSPSGADAYITDTGVWQHNPRSVSESVIGSVANEIADEGFASGSLSDVRERVGRIFKRRGESPTEADISATLNRVERRMGGRRRPMSSYAVGPITR